MLLRDRGEDLAAAGIRAVAISRDSPWSHRSWAEALGVHDAVPDAFRLGGRGDASVRRRDRARRDARSRRGAPSCSVTVRSWPHGCSAARCRTWTRRSPPLRPRRPSGLLRLLRRRHVARRPARRRPLPRRLCARLRRAVGRRLPPARLELLAARAPAASAARALGRPVLVPARVRGAAEPAGLAVRAAVLARSSARSGPAWAYNLVLLLTFLAAGGFTCWWLRSLGLARAPARARRRAVRTRAVPRPAEHGPPARADLVPPAGDAARARAAALRPRGARAHGDPAVRPGPPRARRDPALRRRTAGLASRAGAGGCTRSAARPSRSGPASSSSTS